MKIFFISVFASLVSGALLFTGFMYFYPHDATSYGNAALAVPAPRTASSTPVTVTTGASVRLMATSTGTSQRIAATIQPINCAGGSLFLSTNADAPAVANKGLFIPASTTQQFGMYPSPVPVPQGSVQGITTTATCTVLVTEWIQGN